MTGYKTVYKLYRKVVSFTLGRTRALAKTMVLAALLLLLPHPALAAGGAGAAGGALTNLTRAETNADVPRITPLELKELVDSNETVLVLDVRSEPLEEQGLMVIPGALRIPVVEIYRGLGLPEDKAKRIVTYCT